MTKMVAGISRAAIEREAAMMEASDNFIWARKLRALRAALDKAEADNARLREAALREAAELIDKRHRGDLPDHILSEDGNAIRALIDKLTAKGGDACPM